MKMHPLNRVLQRDNVLRIRAVMKERGYVTGARGEIVVVEDSAGEDPSIDLIVSGQHTVIAFFEEAEADHANHNIKESLLEGLKVTRLYAQTPRFAIKYFVNEGNVLNSIKVGEKSFLESLGEVEHFNAAWQAEGAGPAPGGDGDDEGEETEAKPKGKNTGKEYDEKLWTFSERHFKGAFKNVGGLKSARAFRGKLHKAGKLDLYITKASCECDFANSKFTATSLKYILVANAIIWNACEKFGALDIALDVLQTAYPNRLNYIPWIVASRNDAISLKAAFDQLTETPANKLSVFTGDRKVFPGDFSRLTGTRILDIMNMMECAAADVDVSRIDSKHARTIFGAVLQLCVSKKATVNEVSKSLTTEEKGWVHPTEHFEKTFDEYWTLKRHLRKLFVHLHHPDSKGFRMVDAVSTRKTKTTDDESAVHNNVFKMNNEDGFTLHDKASLRLVILELPDSTPDVDMQMVGPLLALDNVISKHGTPDVRVNTFNKFKRSNPLLADTCSELPEMLEAEDMPSLTDMTDSSFFDWIVKLLAPFWFSDNDTGIFYRLRAAVHALLATKEDPARAITLLAALSSRLAIYTANDITFQMLKQWLEIRSLYTICLLHEALAIIIEDADADTPFTRLAAKVKTNTVPALFSAWMASDPDRAPCFKLIECTADLTGRNQWVFFWSRLISEMHTFVAAGKHHTPMKDSVLQGMVKTKVGRLNVAQLKEALGALHADIATTGGNKDALLKALMDAECTKSRETDTIRVEESRASMLTMLTHVVAAKTSAFDDGLSKLCENAIAGNSDYYKTSSGDHYALQLTAAIQIALMKAVREDTTFYMPTKQGKSTKVFVARPAPAASAAVPPPETEDATVDATVAVEVDMAVEESKEKKEEEPKVEESKEEEPKEEDEPPVLQSRMRFPARVVVCQYGFEKSIAEIRNYHKAFCLGTYIEDGTTYNILGIPLPAMLKLGSKVSLAWSARVASADTEATCSIEWHPLDVPNTIYTFQFPELVYTHKDADDEFTEIVRPPFDVERMFAQAYQQDTIHNSII